jgi:hypothetical protein
MDQNGRVVYLKKPASLPVVDSDLGELEAQFAGGAHAGILSNRS